MRPHQVAIHRLEGRLEGGEYILVSISQEAIGDLGAALRIELIGQRDLLSDEFGFTPKVQGKVRRAAIRTIQSQSVNTIGSSPNLAIETTQKIFTNRERAGTMAGLHTHRH